MEEKYNLAPDIRKTIIGVREAKDLTLYPVSIASENELLNDFINIFSSFTEFQGMSDSEVGVQIKNYIFDNLENVLSHVTDEPPELSDITNMQLLAICEIIFEVNFEVLLKNLPGFVEKMSQLFNSMKQSPE